MRSLEAPEVPKGTVFLINEGSVLKRSFIHYGGKVRKIDTGAKGQPGVTDRQTEGQTKIIER